MWLVGPLASLACSGTASKPVRALVRDSAGIVIVENADPLASDSIAYQLDSIPAVQIGGSGDPRTEFGRVAGVLRLRDGLIVIADGENNELRFFDSTGVWQRTVGRKGGGPGEFEQLGAVFPLGPDSFAVYDLNHRRVSVLGRDGNLIQETTLPQDADAGFPSVIGALGSNLLVQRQAFSHSSPKSGPRRDSVPVFRYPRWAAPAQLLGRLPGTDIYVEVQGSGGVVRSVMSTMLPFGLRLTLSAASDQLYAGNGESYEISVYDREGRLARLLRRSQVPDPVTEEDIAAIKRERLEGFRPGSEALRDQVKKILDGMTYPATKPAYASFVAGEGQWLWVRRFDQPATNLPARYDVFDPGGQWLGHVDFPTNFILLHTGAGFALGVWKDSDDVEYVRLYHLLPAR